MKENYNWKFLLAFLLLIGVIHSQCYVSDGNYYDFSLCMNECLNQNQVTNATVEQAEETEQCCTPLCHSQVSYHTIKRTIIIIIASVLLFLVCLCCIFGCCGPTVQMKWVMHKEEKLREIYRDGISPEQFDAIATNFTKIFTEQQRDNWTIIFTLHQQKLMMNWFQIIMYKTRDYQYSMKLKGQDILGLWTVEGYFVNIRRGPTCWGIKNYSNSESNATVFYNQNDLIFELTRFPNQNYEGKWYSRKFEGKHGSCSLRKRGTQQSEGLLQVPSGIYEEINSAPQTEQRL